MNTTATTRTIPVTLNPGQLDALRAIAKGGRVARFVATNLTKRGLIATTPSGALALTTEGLTALADAAKAVCHDGRCTLGADHRGDHIDADGYRLINWYDWK
jgi:hypothetical protein